MPRRLVTSAAVAALVLIAIPAVALLAWSSGHARQSFQRLVSWQLGRPIEVRGELHLHVLTRSPGVEAERVTIGNPSWTKPGVTAEIAKLSVTLAPLMSGRSGFGLVRIDGARLYFGRDIEGHANWQRSNPDESAGGPLPMIRELELTHAHLSLDDERLHLAYDGDLSIAGPDSAEALRIEGSGSLNEHPVTFRLKGAALPSAVPGKPYAFELEERSSGARFTAHGSLPRPFDLGMVDAGFEAGGADLRDLYQLLGVSLPNTGAFALKGHLSRRGSRTQFDDLEVRSGQSDVHGRMTVDTQQNGRTMVRAEFGSMVLRLADVGLRAAGRDPHPDVPPRLFSDVRLITPATRRVDVSGHFTAERLLMSRVEVDGLSAQFTIEQGHIRAPRVTGRFLGGAVALQLDADANQTPARARIEMTLTDLQLAQVPRQPGPPPFGGSLSLKIQAQGRGDSLHALAAGADGSVGVRVGQGTVRASLAELTGVDLRGLGLVLSRSNDEMPVRCAAADFEVRAGVMLVTRFFIDARSVFIGGGGRVTLEDETLDLKLHGEPKGLRILRLKAPVLVQGTLLQPRFSVDLPDSSLRLVDRGAAHDADCAAFARL